LRRRNTDRAVRWESAAPVFAALGDPTRLRLVERLTRDGPQSIVRLSSGFPMTRQAITKHLRVMEHAGLVRSAPRGRTSIWQFEPQRLNEAQRQLQVISTRWDETLGRLRQLVEIDGTA
jgi:DNA-binding transcriptional ArsR family regulator